MSAAGSSRFFAMVKYLDFFSEGVGLNVGGHSVFRTAYGSLFTALYMAIMLIIVVINASKYLDKTRPLSVGDVFTRKLYPEINLLDNNLLPVIVAYSNETEWITAGSMSKYFTIVAHKITWRTETNNITNQLVLRKEFQIFPTKPCR